MRWKLVDENPQQSLFDDEELMDHHVGRGEFAGMEFLHVNAKRIINTIPSAAHLPFGHTINAYRGCNNRCVYCFARPTHAYLDLGIGEDFDRKIVVKVNAVERTRAEVSSPKWSGESIAMGTNTDPYQRCEGKYHLTRGIVGVLGEARNPFSILTKSTLILRDLDVLKAAAARTAVHTSFSIGTLDEEVWKLTEPGTPHPKRRVEAVAKLNQAGIPCGVLVAPVLPGLSDRPDQLRAVVEACAEAGATSISAIPLHLRPGVRGHFFDWLAGARPDLMPKYERLYGNRSYLPKAEQAAITDLVAGLREEQPRRRPRRSAISRARPVKMAPGGTNGQDRRSSS